MHKKEGVKGSEESGPGSWTKRRFKPSQKPVELARSTVYECTKGITIQVARQVHRYIVPV